MKYINCFFISIFIHSLLLLMVLFHFIHQPKIDRHGLSYLPIYAYQSSFHRTSLNKSNPLEKWVNREKKAMRTTSTNKNNNKELMHTISKSQLSQQQNKIDNSKKLIHTISKSQLSQQQSKIDKNTIHQTLLSIIHDKIASKQIYPESAIMLNQTGTVSIRFMLDPNGSIINASLQKSSGVESIDLAALNAVKMASSIIEAAHYLHNSELFEIDVIFQ
jgi:TonB family protein